ncbi:MAG: TrkA family potassium uptake protein [Oscillospiraceae bacterium]
MNKNSSELYGIIGLGRFGFALAQSLSEAGKDILVIDCNESKIKDATAFTNNAFMVTSLGKETLQEVGIKNCDTVIVGIGEKIDISILTALNLISMGIKHVIAKAISVEHGYVLEKIGAEVIYPEKDMAIRLTNRLVSSRVMDYISLSDEIDISEMKFTHKLNGSSVCDLDLRKKFGLNIIAIKRDSDITTEILPTFCLLENDILVLVGKRVNIKKFEIYLSNI